MKVLIKTFIACCLLITTTVIKAQQILPSDIPSPNAASLGKFGDVPVSYYTGRPNMSIPLYTLSVRDFDFPVNLVYDAGGVLVNSLPSWTGQNWTLEAGGVITRTVQGRYDEWVYPKQMNQPNAKNFYQSIGVLPTLMQQSQKNYANLKNDVVYGFHDLAPDIFTFNFCGKSGKFFLDNNGNWRVLGTENLEILFDYTNQNNFISPIFKTYPYKQAVDNTQRKTIKGFKIRDAKGYTYEFGMKLDAIDFTTNIWHMSKNEQNESWHAMSWYLSRVTDRYGNELVALNYERGVYVIQAYNAFEFNHVKEDASWGIYGHYGQEYSGANSQFPFGLTISSPVYLKEIKGNNGVTVSFSSINDPSLATEHLYPELYSKAGGIAGLYNLLASMVPAWGKNQNGGYGEGAFYYLQSDDAGLSKFRFNSQKNNKLDILSFTRLRRLQSIAISAGINTYGPSYALGYRFYYGYVNNRMFLDSIQIQNDAIHYSSLTGNIGFYRFKYQDKDKLPASYLTTAIDHWGYYNGNAYSIPSADKYASFKEKRNPNIQYAKMGSLSEIEYPTGGVSKFEYEPNDYSACQTDDRQSLLKENGIGGGLRIKSITEYDGADCVKILKKRTYEYVKPGTSVSSGELFATPKYYWQKWNSWCIDGSANREVETFRTSSIIPLSNSFGPSLGYSYVRENILDIEHGSGNLKSTLYRFSNLSDVDMKDEKFYLSFNNGLPSPEDMFSERGFKRGKLMSQTVYDGSNQKMESITYRYRSGSELNSQFTYTSNLVYGNNGCSASFGCYGGGIYKLYYPQYDVKEERDTIFYSKSNVVTSIQYEKVDVDINSAQPYRHLTSVRLLNSVKTVSGNDELTQKYSYGNLSDNSLTTQLHRDLFYLSPQEKQFWHNGAFSSKEVVCYDKVDNKLIVPSAIVKTYSSGQIDTLIAYGDYTASGQPQTYKKLGKPRVYQRWGYHDNYLMVRGNAPIPMAFSEEEVFNEKNV